MKKKNNILYHYSKEKLKEKPNIKYKYINTMGEYVITIDNIPINDISVAISFNINPNEYRDICEKFRCYYYNGKSYFESIEKIEALLVLLKLMR